MTDGALIGINLERPGPRALDDEPTDPAGERPGPAEEPQAGPPEERAGDEPLDGPAEGPDGCEEKLKRALADYANLQRRTESQISARVEDGVNSAVSDMLRVRDDFARAREAYSAGGVDTAGLDSVMKNLDALLEGRGVRPIEALGGPFDPNLHEAVSSAPRPDVPEGTVVEEVRRGYRSRNRIIRPTLAIVSTKDG